MNIPWDGIESGEHTCSIPGCDKTEDDYGYPLTYVTVRTRVGEEGYAEVGQALCDEHFFSMQEALRLIGFESHRHGGINYLENQDSVCGGWNKCPFEHHYYGPELVQ